MEKQYVVYVGSHTNTSDSKGITLFDVDVEGGRLRRRGEVEVDNPSYLTTSPNGKILYSITDKGVASFQILPDGNLKRLNTAAIRGMRGCYISSSRDNRFLFVSGYHDGKITVLKVNEDGSAGSIVQGIFHKGPGSVAERNFKPHIRCAQLTPDEKYCCVLDSGIDQMKIYRFNHETGELTPCDIYRCQPQSSPRRLIFSRDGKYMYMIKELSNDIAVFRYDGSGKLPVFEKLQVISTLGKQFNEYSAAVALKFTKDEKYLFCTNAGDHSLGIFSRDAESGLLTQMNVLPISGRYPTDMEIFPDGRHVFVTNYDSNTITTFSMNYENGTIVMSSEPIPIEQPKCAVMVEVPQE